MSLPTQYRYLLDEPGPKMLQVALSLYGTTEIVGHQHNPVILQWADVIGIGNLVNDDEQAWCGLFMAYVAIRAQKHVPMTSWDMLRALKWGQFGRHTNVAMLGDVLVFKRDGGGHVGLYVGEDRTHYHVLGGNQGNRVSIVRIAKNRIHVIRRPDYITRPANVRVIFLTASGELSHNEA